MVEVPGTVLVVVAGGDTGSAAAAAATTKDVSRFLLPLSGSNGVAVVVVAVDVPVFIFTKGVLDDTIRRINRIEKNVRRMKTINCFSTLN